MQSPNFNQSRLGGAQSESQLGPLRLQRGVNAERIDDGDLAAVCATSSCWL